MEERCHEPNNAGYVQETGTGSGLTTSKEKGMKLSSANNLDDQENRLFSRAH